MRTAKLDLFLGLNLSKLLLLLVELLGSAGALFANHEVSVSFVFYSSLLDGINLDILGANIVLELRDLALQVLNHLLARLQDLLFRVVVRVGPMELSLLLL